MKNSSQLFAFARTTATATLLAVCLLTVASCTKLRSGQSFVAESDGINYRYEVIISNHNYVRVTPVSGPEAVTGAINIPSTVRHEDYTYVVTQIGANAFSNYTGITSITIPGTVSIIETNAFRNCQSLTTVNVSNSISTIDAYAFENCSQLQSFHFATSLSTLGQGCFRGCSSLTTADLPSTITAVPDEAFNGCTSLSSLRLPATIMQIGNKAFAHCTGLRSIYLDRSVQQIGDSTFFDCDSVQSITCLTSTPPACSVTTFGNMPTAIPVTVMMSSINNYQVATGWNRFTNYIGTY